jgi:hypothetical protein
MVLPGCGRFSVALIKPSTTAGAIACVLCASGDPEPLSPLGNIGPATLEIWRVKASASLTRSIRSHLASD